MGIVFQDFFTEPTTDTNLDAHTPDTGTSWTNRGNGTILLIVRETGDFCQTDVRANSTHTAHEAIYTVGTADYDVEIDITAESAGADSAAGVFGRFTDVDNLWCLRVFAIPAVDTFLQKRVAGSRVTVASGDTDNNWTTATIKLEMRGDVIKFFFGATEELSVTDADLENDTEPGGLYTGNLVISLNDAEVDWKFDNFKITEVTTGATGTGALSLEAFSMKAVGVMQPSGAATLTLQDNALTAVGVMQPSSAAVLTLQDDVLIASGLQKFLGTATPTFEVFSMAASGLQKFLGTAAPALEVFSMTASGVMLPVGTSTLDLAQQVLAAAGEVATSGTAALSLGDFSLVVVGVMQPAGVVAAALEEFVLAAAGVAGALEGTVTLTVGGFTLTAVGIMQPSAVSAPTLEEFLITAVGVSAAPEGIGAPNFENFVLISVGVMQPSGASDLVMQPMVLSAVGIGGIAAAVKQLIRGFTRNVGRLMNP